MAPWGFLPGCRIDAPEGDESLVMRTVDTVSTRRRMQVTNLSSLDWRLKLTESRVRKAD